MAMKKAAEEWASAIAQRAVHFRATRKSEMPSTPSVANPTHDDPIDKQVEQGEKDLNHHLKCIEQLDETLVSHIKSMRKNQIHALKWSEGLMTYGQVIATDGGSSQVGACFATLSALTRKQQDLLDEVQNALENFQSQLREVKESTIERAKQAVTKYETVKKNYIQCYQSMKSHEKKAAPDVQKLMQLEVEFDQARVSYKTNGKETAGLLEITNESCTWNMVLRLTELMENTCSTYQRQNYWGQENVMPLMKVYKSTVIEQNSKTESKQAAKWHFVSPKTTSDPNSPINPRLTMRRRPSLLLGTEPANFLKRSTIAEASRPQVLSDSQLNEIGKILSFEVEGRRSGMGKRKKTMVDINISDGYMTVRSGTDGKPQKRNGEDVLQCIKSLNNPKKLTMFWRNNEERLKDILIFSSQEIRERFYEHIHFLMIVKQSQPNLKSVIPTQQDVEVFCGTWNMGEAPPTDLEPFIARNKADIYVINTQECSYFPLLRAGNTNLESDWFDYVTTHLGKAYVKLMGVSLFNIRIIVCIRREHFYKVTDVEASHVATGIGGVIGNKGAVAISFKFNETSFCFIGSHLCARQDEWQNRNDDFRDIMKELRLGKKSLDVMSQFNHVFWMGDLNYRVDMERMQVLDHISRKDLGPLLKVDQLLVQMKLGNAFSQWNEGPILFPPTYRYDRGSRNYSNEKERTPSWCDRILWRSHPENPIRQSVYTCSNEPMTSDHSPVFAYFTVSTKRPSLPLVSLARNDSLITNGMIPSPCPCKILILNLRAENIGSDLEKANLNAYVTFYMNFLEGSKSTDVISKNLNPVWKDHQVPMLLPFVYNSDLLASQVIVVVVKSRGVSDEEIGQGYISLSIDPNGSDFITNLFNKGKNVGYLKGKVQIVYDYGSTDHQRGSGDSESPANSPSGASFLRRSFSPHSKRNERVGMATSPSSTSSQINPIEISKNIDSSPENQELSPREKMSPREVRQSVKYTEVPKPLVTEGFLQPSTQEPEVKEEKASSPSPDRENKRFSRAIPGVSRSGTAGSFLRSTTGSPSTSSSAPPQGGWLIARDRTSTLSSSAGESSSSAENQSGDKSWLRKSGINPNP